MIDERMKRRKRNRLPSQSTCCVFPSFSCYRVFLRALLNLPEIFYFSKYKERKEKRKESYLGLDIHSHRGRRIELRSRRPLLLAKNEEKKRTFPSSPLISFGKLSFLER
ncbi:hypothetical protein CSUI_010712 [Cystoisospora suis]|uniref:Uncharacterized protein n=1 Tax=Cystoisospora suis TaxID=483139 RepID=A0A2C6KGL6_9APIC|nr:hypothetical protein CSUI_010712 [Cystoisospora suis]